MTTAVSFHPEEETICEQEPVQDKDQSCGGTSPIFNMKVHQSKAHLSDSKGHDVTFNVTFAMAIPGVFTTVKNNESFSTRNSSADQFRGNSQYFHIEFDLFSKEIHKEPHKTDIGFYGSYAKIYPDKSESRVIPTWSDGEDTWICWGQKFVVRITNEHVQSFCGHKMRVKIWDTKDKCTPKVRFDHPKPLKSASRSRSTNELTNWTKQMIMMISHDFSNTASFLEDSDRILPHQIISTRPMKKETDKNVPRTKSAKSNTTTKSSVTSPDSATKEKETLLIIGEPKNSVDRTLGSYAQLEKLIETNSPEKIRSTTRSAKRTTEIHSAKITDQSNTVRSESRKSIIVPADAERYNKMGRTSLDVRVSELFLWDRSVSRIATSVNTLEDMFCMVSIEDDILSMEQRRELKPLIINIKKVNNMPHRGVDRTYSPVYLQYNFCDLEPYQTIGRGHRTNIKFDDINVILLGALDEIKLRSQLLHSFFTVQLFDRIEIEKEENMAVSSDEDNGVSMGDITITSSKPTMTSVESDKPYGEAKVDLSDIVTKRLKYLDVMVPIVPTCSAVIKPDMGSSKSAKEDNCGSYLEAGTTLKVSFKLAEPMVFVSEPLHDSCYNRIVVVNNDIQSDFIRKVIAVDILKNNCKKLNFNSQVLEDMRTFLYGATKQMVDDDMLFRGFYLVDRRCEILLVESSQRSISTLYKMCSTKLDMFQEKNVNSPRILYNESLVLSDRENFPVLTMLPLTLSKDISFFVSQPLMYVRDTLPRACVDGICKIKDLLNVDSMHIVLRNKLIPTSEMMESVSQYLCSHIKDEATEESHEVAHVEKKANARKIQRKDIKTAPVVHRKKIRQPFKRPKTQLNVEFAHPEPDREFSYSCQSKNAIYSAKEAIRSQLDPNRRYTYSQEYLFSGSFDPVDISKEYIEEERMERSEPRWTNKEHSSIIKEIASINTLPQSRKEELQTPWLENVLHRSFMEPTLPERDSRSYNFDLLIRPLDILHGDTRSIMPSYVEQAVCSKTKKQLDCDIWRKKICVSDLHLHCHRVLPATEMLERGRTSSNQIAKLMGLRKDKSAVRQSSDLNQIPATFVHPSASDINRAFTVGPDSDRNLLVNNVPVIAHDQHFRSVYNASKESFIYKNMTNFLHNQFVSPFSICN